MPRYKVSLYTCPGNLPFAFARHPWFVIENNGLISRWEVLFRKELSKPSWGHLYKNHLPAYSGIGLFPYSNKFLWKARFIGSIEGDKESLAQHISEFLENFSNTYPYRDQYFITGPNSNTFIQWVLNKFPEFKVKLPWNAFGKNYHG